MAYLLGTYYRKDPYHKVIQYLCIFLFIQISESSQDVGSRQEYSTRDIDQEYSNRDTESESDEEEEDDDQQFGAVPDAIHETIGTHKKIIYLLLINITAYYLYIFQEQL